MFLERTRIELNEQAQKLAFQWFLRKGRVPKILIEIIEGTKYNPNWESQPRVPAGSSDGGQWTGGGGSSGGAATSPKPSSDKPMAKPSGSTTTMKPPQTLRFSSDGAAELLRFEGYSNTVYRDDQGYLTIGYGHKLLPGESFPNGIAREEARQLYMQDMRIAERAVQRYVKVPLSQGQFDALVSFTYNIGQGRLRSSTLLRLLNQGKYEEAADEILKWNKKPVNGVYVPDRGRTNRRCREREMFLRNTSNSSG